MISFLLRRLTHVLPLLFVMSLIVFWVTNILPGDPTTTILGDYATQEQRDTLRKDLGLDQPLIVRFGSWISHTATGDLGISIKTKQPVAQMLVDRVPVTLELTLLTVLASVLIGLPIGIIAAIRRDTWVDTAASAVSLSGMAIPYFWVGILLILAFSIHLRWLPPSGYVPFLEDPLGNLRLMIMPVITIATAQAALIMRQMRTSMLQITSQDFVRTARAKGAGEMRVIFGHVLRNSLIPVVTVIGLQIGTLIGGTVVIESIFALPGLGRMIVDGIAERDYPVVQGAIIVVVFCVLIINLITDLTYHLIDPRVEL